MKELQRERYRSTVFGKKIHHLDREDKLLGRIKGQLFDAVVAGLGHSDYWFENASSLGVNFDRYCTDVVDGHSHGVALMRFAENARPNPAQVYEREVLKREIRLIESGRVVNTRDPDFVGLWDIQTPFHGYFEMFVDTRGANGNISGTIEDLIGSATFEGIVSDGEIRFRKKYIAHSPDALREEIDYVGRKSGRFYRGNYGVSSWRRMRVPFLMINSPREDPLELFHNA